MNTIWNPGPPETWLQIKLKPLTEEEEEEIRKKVAKKIEELRQKEEEWPGSQRYIIPREVLWRTLD